MRLYAVTLLAACFAAGAAAGTVPSVDPETGLATWQTETDGIQVRLTQITPDQARAFYSARGFSPAAAEHYARECVFMTVIRNVGTSPLEYRLADWRYRSAGGSPRAIRSKDEWDRVWLRLGVDKAARIAFNWAQIPTAHHYAPGDWNQGMTAYSVPRGGRFDLEFTWQTAGVRRTATLENVRCADEHS